MVVEVQRLRIILSKWREIWVIYFDCKMVVIKAVRI